MKKEAEITFCLGGRVKINGSGSYGPEDIHEGTPVSTLVDRAVEKAFASIAAGAPRDLLRHLGSVLWSMSMYGGSISLSVESVCFLVDRTRKTVLSMIKSGELSASRVSGKYRILWGEVRRVAAVRDRERPGAPFRRLRTPRAESREANAKHRRRHDGR